MKRSLPIVLLVFAIVFAAQVSWSAEGRHALIIGIGEYSQASQTTALPGVPKDMENARKMARAMGIDDAGIVELRDSQASKANIVAALEKLSAKVQAGDRVLIYYSGHGTRYGSGNKCVEGLQTYSVGPFNETDVLSEEDLARYTYPISEKADKLITLVDACFSGGVLGAKTRSLIADLGIRAKVSPAASNCAIAVNHRNTRSFEPAMLRLGAAKENFVQIAAANYNEVSWDFPVFGGLATHSLTQCLLGDAKDLDRSGAISLEEIRRCAQAKVDQTMQPHVSKGMLSSTIQIRGTRNLIVVSAAADEERKREEARRRDEEQRAEAQRIAEERRLVEERRIAEERHAAERRRQAEERRIAEAQMAAEIRIAEEQAKLARLEEAKRQAEEKRLMDERRQAEEKRKADEMRLAEELRLAEVKRREEERRIAEERRRAEEKRLADERKAEEERRAEEKRIAAERRPIASKATLEDILAQRNGRLKLEVHAPTQLAINKDSFKVSVRSNTDGYLYAVMLGSDGQSFYLLFPNKLDQDNKIKANTAFNLPRPGWSIKAGGPEGTNHVLFVVSQSPRDPKIFAPDEAVGGGPFTFAVTDINARKRVIDFFMGRGLQGRNGQMAATLVSIKEVP